ncbi:hypothetical protein CPC08DRAFT_382424 [Agrocybe pediades]|nr:hypothetical protein CPC08DRAFT_382424 [Agrocybe pediades]
MAALGLDNTSERRKEYEIIKRHLRNFSNTRLETFKPATSQPKRIRAAMEDLQMEWPNIFNMHVPAAEERLDLARAYLYRYHSRRAAKLRGRSTEASAPKLEPPTRKTKFRPSFSKESGLRALNLVEPTRDVLVSVPDCERTQHAISTPPSHLPHQPSPSIVSPSRTSSTPSSQRTQAIDENVLSFLSSCQPPLTHLANVFTEIGCLTAQHLLALASISSTDEQSRYMLLKRVFGGRRVTEMEIMIVERQLALV